MKKIFTIIFLLAAVFINAQQWEIVSEPYISSSLLDIYFVSENIGWGVGNDGTIIKTEDGGNTWTEQNSTTTKDIGKVFFLNDNQGWAGTGANASTPGGTILKTTDGGNTWTEIDYSSAVPNVAFTYCDGLLFLNDSTGYLLAGKSKSNYVLKTTDGGLTWVKKDSLVTTTTTRWYDIDFYNDNLGVIVGSAKDVQRYTTDGGETWIHSTSISDPFFKDLKAVKWISENEILAIGEGQEFQGVPIPIYKSIDAGATWIKKTQSPTNSYDRARGLYFKNTSEGIAIGTNGFSYPFIYKTSDGGETWTPSNASLGFSFTALCGLGDVLFGLGASGMIAKSTDFGETWTAFKLKPLASIYGIQFINDKGYAVQSNGTVLKSEDTYGEDWGYISDTGLWLAYSMVFNDENTGLIHKENSHIVKTTDGGVTWNSVLGPVVFSSRNKVGGLSFGDASTGYAWMSLNDYTNYYIYKTTDGGDSWNEIYNISGSDSPSGGIEFFDANYGFIAGSDMWIKYTTDGGDNWNDAVINNLPGDFSAATDIEDVKILNANTAFAVGLELMLKTTDKGASWNYIDYDHSVADSSFFTVSFLDDQLGYIGTYERGLILKTTNGGSSWEEDDTYKDIFRFYSSGFNNHDEVYFGTSNGYIIKWNIPVTDVKDDNVAVKDYLLAQNYPNPFNPVTNIRYSISNGQFVSLKVFDVLGKEVATLVNGEKPAGEYTVKFDASDLASGVYIYKIQAGEFIQSKKLILMK